MNDKVYKFLKLENILFRISLNQEFKKWF